MKSRERPFKEIPWSVRLILLAMLLAQLFWVNRFGQDYSTTFTKLDQPSDISLYRVAALGSERLMSYLLALRVQLHDSQAGQHFAYARLDFNRLRSWLLLVYRMNPLSDYPGFLAARVYSQNADPDRVRIMVDVVERLFEADPGRHWRRMTEACLLAKHQLGDLPLALALAKKLNLMSSDIAMPFWARDMEIILLDELGEMESARLLISSLLQNGQIEDADERRFLESRLLKIQQSLSNTEQNSR